MKNRADIESTLSHERILALLSYNEATGAFHWKKTRFRAPLRKIGEDATSKAGARYRGVCIDGYRHPAHRLAWFIVHGRFPKDEIDHIDRNPLNNAISNLREASRVENLRNRKAQGCHWRADVGAYQARIGTTGKRVHLGYFPTIDEAHAAYRLATLKYFGEFSAFASQGVA